MSVIPQEKLAKLVERYETIQAELNQGAPQATYVKLTKELSELTPLISAVRDLEAAETEKRDLEALVRDPVCGMLVDPAEAPASLERNGTRLSFCSRGCRDQFLAESTPAGYSEPAAHKEAIR